MSLLLVILIHCITNQPAWTMPDKMWGAENYFDFNDDERQHRLTRLGIPSISGTGPRLSKGEAAAARDGWKSVHMSYFAGFGLEWPPTLSDAKHICLDGVRAREAEVVFLADSVFEMEHEQELLDGNSKVEMTLQGCSKENLETGELEVKKSPWKRSPRTIVGSTKLFLRYMRPVDDTVKKKKFVRAAVATEYMRLIGWDDAQWVRVPSKSPQVAIHECHEINKLCSNFCGNAWSSFHFLPLRMATVSTIGRFGKINSIPIASDIENVVDAGKEAEAEQNDDADNTSTDSSSW